MSWEKENKCKHKRISRYIWLSKAFFWIFWATDKQEYDVCLDCGKKFN